MSFSGYVSCNCIRDGRLKNPPPFPASYDPATRAWRLLTPEAETDPESEIALTQHAKLRRWARFACEHEFQIYFSTLISGNWGVRTFYETVMLLGADNYPVLAAYVPHTNDGTVPAEHVAAMRAELVRYQAEKEIGVSTRLLDSNDNHVIYDGGRDIAWHNPALTYGFDHNGFYVLQSAHAQGSLEGMMAAVMRALAGGNPEVAAVLNANTTTLFRSMRFDQRPDGDDIGDAPHFIPTGDQDVHLIDAETGFTLVVETGITRRVDGVEVHPRQIRVETAAYGPERVYYVVDRILSLCDAALEVGGAIHWA